MQTATLAQPDNGASPADSTVLPDGGARPTGLWAQVADVMQAVPHAVWYAAAAIVIAVGLASSIRIAVGARKTSLRQMRGDKFLTFLAAGVSTGVVANGMWKFFGDVLNIDNPIARGALFAVFEIAMLASAVRSRRFRLDRAAKQADDSKYKDSRIDVDGIAVWVLALISGCFAAADEHTNTAKAVRVITPLLAAWMWERGLAGELMQFNRSSKRLNLRITPERILTWLRLAEPSEREVAEVERQRRIARFARTAYRLHLLQEHKPTTHWRVRFARWQLRRQTESGNEHLNLAADQAALGAVRAQLALLYTAEDATGRAAVADINPLRPATRMAIAATPYAPPTETPTGDASRATEDASVTDTSIATTDANMLATTDDTETAMQSAMQDATESATVSARKVAIRTAKKPATNPATEGAHPTAMRLAKWLAKYPVASNGELAKRMNVGERTVSRYRADAEALNAAREEAAERVVRTPIPEPKKAVLHGTNGKSYPPEETN